MAKNVIELEYIKPPTHVVEDAVYKVTRIVDSIKYNPGEILAKKEVETLCSGSRFTVRIK